MPDTSLPGVVSNSIAAHQARAALAAFLPQKSTTAERVRAVEAVLSSPAGELLRGAMARWIVDETVPVERLVPPAYAAWRRPVRDAMMFVVRRLSPERLAPKLVEQLDLPVTTPAEERLLRLIAKTPGLQKLGQVIARNQHLRPALRTALTRLENGIRDVTSQEIRGIIQAQLGPRLKQYQVEIAPAILSEASVSAVVRFTWRDPGSGGRGRGVFKVLKPHVPAFFAEDMQYLQELAQYFGDRRHSGGLPRHLLPDTFKKVRRLLRHEVNFRREQATLEEAGTLYRKVSGVRVPRVIRPLCTKTITALTEERGVKVTNAASRLPAARRRQMAEQLVEALVAIPLAAAETNVIFHGDPHAGNLLYDTRTKELVILDWALRERLARGQRRHLALLFLTMTLRDPVGTFQQVMALGEERVRPGSRRAQRVQATVQRFLDELPLARISSGADVMTLLTRSAQAGVKFPRALVVLSKAMFTLDGILADMGVDGVSMGAMVARRMARRWIADRRAFRSPLFVQDWISLPGSALLLGSRMWLRCEQALLDRVLPAPAGASSGE